MIIAWMATWLNPLMINASTHIHIHMHAPISHFKNSTWFSFIFEMQHSRCQKVHVSLLILKMWMRETKLAKIYTQILIFSFFASFSFVFTNWFSLSECVQIKVQCILNYRFHLFETNNKIMKWNCWNSIHRSIFFCSNFSKLTNYIVNKTSN